MKAEDLKQYTPSATSDNWCSDWIIEVEITECTEPKALGPVQELVHHSPCRGGIWPCTGVGTRLTL